MCKIYKIKFQKFLCFGDTLICLEKNKKINKTLMQYLTNQEAYSTETGIQFTAKYFIWGGVGYTLLSLAELTLEYIHIRANFLSNKRKLPI